MEGVEAYGFSAAMSGAFLVSSLLFAAFNRRLREPYMDEVFHVPQAQAYCHGSFLQWDPMITTLPGLYLLSVGVVKPAAWLFGWTGPIVCSTGMLRFINLLFSAGNFYLLYLLLLKIHQKNKAVSGFQRILSSLTLAIFPTLYFFTFLYYTDPGSVFFTLFAYLMCLYGNHKASALLGFCGFMFRQTNIVWTVFCAGNVVAEKLNEAWKTELLKKKDEKVSAMKGSFPDLIRVLKFLIEYLTSPKNLVTLVALTWPYIILVTAFFVFVFVNGGIVVGDRSSHEACLHFPQLFYFLSFTVFFSFPHLLTPTKISKFLLSLRKHPVQYGLITIISLFLVWKFTYVHKYLLADNRHYTFYVWRKIFQRHELVKYALVPAYIFAGWSFFDTLKTKPVFWTLMYFVCLLAVTVPQKLLEFRYFILPFLIYRLNIPFPSLSRQLLELAFYIAVNVVAFFLFLNKTFQWPNSVEVQRFMW
ncbi:dol-P-Glc:Glc(2)Man(9)GlcNAc(2)-PP-Dol alpha-1,2-glucosyltransferase isoform X1 [Anas platyrhynchos]|uniref:Dol-P-Glc:Glc(2)Man(9)GlcNAc(2)-PP-Dol alpha-1,2-glucosyltransferase n=3 Tax=Anas TaxID=8835 RepID=U3J9S2_ANAPP|nr:putative Dol-P-Glc:Glc(2)Man(9)GlcNAc(2)-PP-Dol alpha-1,2-glucosyltransferase isoform X1 [Anas platyrhynchos]|eukprot:XP_027314640.1 putative Dol-P-Glc:Glc(2)Man(9)GlcNAc(2)-PP-Dol alpha-1,2-glucosyltransferase isoform X1 [Anas platyrhynchos]